MLDWRLRAQLRRRARRRYLSVVHNRWLAAGAPRAHGQPGRVLVTLLWMIVPFVVASLLAAFMWVFSSTPSAIHPEVSLLLVPLLGLWLLRMLRR